MRCPTCTVPCAQANTWTSTSIWTTIVTDKPILARTSEHTGSESPFISPTSFPEFSREYYHHQAIAWGRDAKNYLLYLEVFGFVE